MKTPEASSDSQAALPVCGKWLMPVFQQLPLYRVGGLAAPRMQDIDVLFQLFKPALLKLQRDAC